MSDGTQNLTPEMQKTPENPGLSNHMGAVGFEPTKAEAIRFTVRSVNSDKQSETQGVATASEKPASTIASNSAPPNTLPYAFVIEGRGVIRSADIPATSNRLKAAFDVMPKEDHDLICGVINLGIGGAFLIDKWFCVTESLDEVPPAAGVYLFEVDGHPVYVGESKNLRTRMKTHKLRFADDGLVSTRKIAGAKLYLCMLSDIGRRFSFEQELITRYRPALNRKGNPDCPRLPPASLVRQEVSS